MVFPTSSAALILLLLHGSSATSIRDDHGGLPKSDMALLEFPLNLVYLEAEFFSWGAFGRGLDSFAPNLTKGGPPPVGARQANLSPLIQVITAQFAFQEIGHLRAIHNTLPAGFARPRLNLSAAAFAAVFDAAFGEPLAPPFDLYARDINFLLASYVIPYVGLTGYVGAIPKLKHAASRRLAAGLLGVESAQDAVLRALLYERSFDDVKPYGIKVAEFTDRISELRNKLGRKGVKDEGLTVETERGAEGKTTVNVVAGDEYSLAYERTPEEILRILYGGDGKESQPGGFYPEGANGEIAQSFLRH